MDKDNKLKILLVDDHVLFRRGIKGILEESEDITVVGEANNGLDGYRIAMSLVPDLILMDIHMPELNGIDSLKLIKGDLTDVKIVMLTIEDQDEFLFESIKHGAHGYLLKNLDPDELLNYIKGVAKGEAPLSKELAFKILAEFSNLAKAATNACGDKNELTQREREVLKYVGDGSTNKEIAARLCISENTVKNHIRNILEKLHMQNRVQAAAYAMREGLI